MRFARELSRLVILSLAAAALAGLTAILGDSVHPALPDPQSRKWREHRPSAPEFFHFPEVIGGMMGLAVFTLGGRIVLRLRLSPASRTKDQPISLGLK